MMVRRALLLFGLVLVFLAAAPLAHANGFDRQPTCWDGLDEVNAQRASRKSPRPKQMARLESETAQPFERRSDESAKAYAAFVIFRDLGPNRSVLKAYRQGTGKAASGVLERLGCCP
jgi:hypothetical protein